MSEEKCLLLIQDGVKAEKEPVELRVVGRDGSVAQLRVQRRAPPSRLMLACCGRQRGAGAAREGLPRGSAAPAACPCWWSPRCFSARILEGSASVCPCAGE